MSRTWSTKKRILGLVSSGAKTPLEISRLLDLAPSTVSEHIEDLERIGAIRRVENPFVKKWKYYEKNPNFNMDNVMGGRRTSGVTAIAAGAVAAAAIVLIIAFVLVQSAPAQGSTVSFRLTDPPTVPNGTEHLNITYSAIAASIVNSSGAEPVWISGSGSGSLDLMALINASQVIGMGRIPSNAIIEAVRFNITSATMVVNGMKYNVSVPNSQLTIAVAGGERITSNSSVLVDLSPTIVTIFTSNSSDFVMVPSAKAVFIGSANVSQGIGSKEAINAEERYSLDRTAPQISISAESLTTTENYSALSITVKNTGNSSVVLRHVTLNGPASVFIFVNASLNASINMSGGAAAENALNLNAPIAMGKAIQHIQYDIAGINVSGAVEGVYNSTVGVSEAGSGVGRSTGRITGNVTSGIAITTSSSENSVSGAAHVDEGGGLQLVIRGAAQVGIHGEAEASAGAASSESSSVHGGEEVKSLINVGRNITAFRVLNFIVVSNGTLELPATSGDVEGNAGYALAAGSTATLTFSGKISYAGDSIMIVPKPGAVYGIVVSGEEGAYTSANVIAS